MTQRSRGPNFLSRVKLPVISIAALLAAGLPAPAGAGVIQYNSEADYTAAVGSEIFSINFDGLGSTFGSGNFAGQVDFGSPEASDPSQVFFASDAMTDAGSTVALNGVGSVDGVFAAPVSAFGFVFSSSGHPQTVELYAADSSLIDSLTSNPGGFFGVLSTTAIASFVLVNGEFSPGMNDRFFVDDFRANAAPAVPAPAAFWLLATGLVGLIALGRRR